MSDLREAFEAWFSKWGMTPKAVIESLREGEEYPQDSMREVNAAWHAWQAALSANGGEVKPAFWITSNDFERASNKLNLLCSVTVRGEWQGLVPLYTHPAPPSVAVPEGWDDDAAKQLEQARQLQEAQYGSSAQTLTAAPSPDHIADAGKVVPIGYLTNQAVARLQSDKRLNGEHLYAFKPDDLSKFQAVYLAPTVKESLTVATPSVPENDNCVSSAYDSGYLDAMLYARACCGRLDNPENTKDYRDCARYLDLVFAGEIEAARLRTAGDDGEE
ncbi:hypothetical protein CBW1004CProp1_gp6 [Phage CBW1004C-Prop1]|nr:hypothetical protein CBW1004CProp1_gp6 [Phage CBW1004C-Prop1]